MLKIIIEHLFGILSLFFAFLHLVGIFLSLKVIMQSRSAQGSIAWAISLITFPLVSVPLYLIFGSRKFYGYVNARRTHDQHIGEISNNLIEQLPESCSILKSDYSTYHTTEKLAKMPFTKGNSVKLLINGNQTFDEIFKAIDRADNYILIQFFIIHNDNLGNKLKEKLIKRAKDGIKIYFMFDEIGSHSLPKTYINELKASGVNVEAFKTTKGPANKFRLNFRNHRKIVIIDGEIGFVGGHNVGDEYLGISKKFKSWRDTHVLIKGPSVQATQLSFIEDWYWITKNVPKLNWAPNFQPENKHILVLPTGPADNYDTCALFFMYAINNAKKRIWITSPYFVPDDPIIASLHLSALKGVDVRIMLPEKPDHILVYLSSFAYLDELSRSGIKFYRYNAGFLHQKVMLIDDNISTVGTANFDNRSFRINFEITLLFVDNEFTEEIEKMLLEDFKNCRETTDKDYHNKPFWFKIAVNIAKLMAPIQ